jgi:hypothetical protein
MSRAFSRLSNPPASSRSVVQFPTLSRPLNLIRRSIFLCRKFQRNRFLGDKAAPGQAGTNYARASLFSSASILDTRPVTSGREEGRVIDVTTERLYALNRARRWFPRRRRGKRPALTTLYRWAGVGFHVVVLETVQVGSTRCTSKEACARFVERVSGLTPRPENASVPGGLKSTREVNQALEAAGFDRRPPRPRARCGQENEPSGGGLTPNRSPASVGVPPEGHARPGGGGGR